MLLDIFQNKMLTFCYYDLRCLVRLPESLVRRMCLSKDFVALKKLKKYWYTLSTLRDAIVQLYMGPETFIYFFIYELNLRQNRQNKKI